ncbi:hypothetical protein BDW74DRAFT_175756 [Aspergillus multicolor]|uniref:uncharacterized protein n=1 Tax=Aspergillus multicolor TaxID=41759 RepID=UPI003CCCAD3E
MAMGYVANLPGIAMLATHGGDAPTQRPPSQSDTDQLRELHDREKGASRYRFEYETQEVGSHGQIDDADSVICSRPEQDDDEADNNLKAMSNDQRPITRGYWAMLSETQRVYLTQVFLNGIPQRVVNLLGEETVDERRPTQPRPHNRGR